MRATGQQGHGRLDQTLIKLLMPVLTFRPQLFEHLVALEEILGIEEDTPDRRRMQARLVREAMTRDPVCVNDETTLDEVVALMDARHVAQFPVVCGPTVVGIIGRVELLGAVAHAMCPAVPDGSGSSAQD